MEQNKGLTAEGICKKYRHFQLKDVSFFIPPGSIMGLLGKNGAGKTTTIKILAGYAQKNSGKIRIDDINMEKEPVKAKSEIGFVIDESMFFEKRTLWENGIAFGRFYQNFTEAEWKKWLAICNLSASTHLESLSKGERTKFQFAFAMAHHPKVLLLDEPTGNLDPIFRKEFLEILLEMVEKEQISVLYSSHITSDLEKIADRISLIEKGKILYTDSMEHMMNRYCMVKGSPEEGEKIEKRNYPEVTGMRITPVGFEAMLDLKKCQEPGAGSIKQDFPRLQQEEVDLEKWMYYILQ